ncbi:MAG: DNA translocase FtsK 4TM domain-containing protein [Clostridia bacterium]|nr:DNA translocase FtsK 4TM domain-containing protein [Clostridia bacterium]HCF65154.1 cell division protein FtsK [Clostridiales bacterium]
MVIFSVLLGVLIYNQSGIMGQQISSILSGVMGFIKYIVPIGTFLIAIYKLCNKKEDAYIKLFQYALLLVCVAIFMHIVYLPKDVEQFSNGFLDTVTRAYEQGKTDDKVGGVIGAIGAIPLTKLLGKVGASILVLGVELILIILIFNINPIEEIRVRLAEREERKLAEEKERIKEERKKPTVMKVEENEDKKETRREKRLREKEEQRRAALELDDQITINLNDDGKSSKKKASEGYIEENLFKKEQEQKQEKVKEVLQLEHALTVEDEHYEFPPVQLLSEGEKKSVKGGKKAVTDTAAKLQKTLYSFGVSAKVENVSVGPAITRYELKPAEGVRVSKIANLADDIALNLAAETIRIEAPIPGKQAVGIEIPNKENEIVHLRDIIDCSKFIEHKSKLAFALGKDVAGEEVVTDIAKMPHVLIAGATGSGKSVCINTLIASIIYKAKPSEVKLVMVDPKVVELSVYNGIPHLLIPVVTDPKKAAGALAWAVQEMENRYSLFASKNVRDIKGYNEELDKEGSTEKLPQIVIIIDELADLMMVSSKEVEDSICRLAQKARAAGMHLVIATQRPSVDVITGIIKANIPSRISFAVSSQVDSRTILDMAGAEKLLGKGDMLFYPAGAAKPTRVQGAFISDKEVEKVVDFVKANGEATYNDDILEQIEKANSTDKEIEEQENDDDTDPLLMEAIEVVVETGQASTSFIQRRFKVGYARAGRIIDQMEERGIISGFQGSKPREVLMSKERWQELKTTSYTQTENV